jgi:hypothetical protein
MATLVKEIAAVLYIMSFRGSADYPKGWPFPTERLAILTYPAFQAQVLAESHARFHVLRAIALIHQ